MGWRISSHELVCDVVVMQYVRPKHTRKTALTFLPIKSVMMVVGGFIKVWTSIERIRILSGRLRI